MEVEASFLEFPTGLMKEDQVALVGQEEVGQEAFLQAAVAERSLYHGTEAVAAESAYLAYA